MLVLQHALLLYFRNEVFPNFIAPKPRNVHATPVTLGGEPGAYLFAPWQGFQEINRRCHTCKHCQQGDFEIEFRFRVAGVVFWLPMGGRQFMEMLKRSKPQRNQRIAPSLAAGKQMDGHRTCDIWMQQGFFVRKELLLPFT